MNLAKIDIANGVTKMKKEYEQKNLLAGCPIRVCFRCHDTEKLTKLTEKYLKEKEDKK
ncbi:hypothetical protein HN803_04345 [candidate division WWE3 bacterium]|jgi:hypothetical protein|nr:hypothetical protein [candidate division WWE3 bacterium]